MTPEEKAAYIMAAAARAIVRAIGAHAENMQRSHQGYSVAYDDAAISAIIDEEGIGENQVLQWLRS